MSLDKIEARDAARGASDLRYHNLAGLELLHREKKLRLVTTVGAMLPIAAPWEPHMDPSPEAFVTELLRLARLGLWTEIQNEREPNLPAAMLVRTVPTVPVLAS